MDAVRGLMFASGLLPDRKSVEADIAIAAESLGGQHDDCGHPADPGHVAQDGRGPGTDVRERVATSARPGAWGRARGLPPAPGRAPGPAPAASGWPAPHRPQKRSAGPTAFPHWLQNGICYFIRYSRTICSRNGRDTMQRMRRLLPGVLLLAFAAALPAAKSLEIYFIDVEGGQATLFVAASGESLLVDRA